MDVLKALGGWRNINQEKLEQIKVDNAPLYDAITKAINLLAKKYGGEDIIVQKPIEVVDQKPTTIEKGVLTDYQILKKIEILGPWIGRNALLESFIDEIGLDRNKNVSKVADFQQDLYAKLGDLAGRYLIQERGNEVGRNVNGETFIDNYELQNKQVEELGPSDEDLKLEILQRMADYYDGNEFKLLSQDDVITNAVKHQFDIPSNKYFGLVVKLLQDGFVEKDPSGLTDSIRLTTEGYDKSQGWYEENKPAEEKPSENLDVTYLRMIQKLREKKGDWVTIEDIVAEKGVPNMLTKQEYIDAQKTILDDLEKRNLVNIVSDEFTISGEGRRLLDSNPEVETPIEQPAQFQPTDLQVSILQAVEEASANNVGDDFVKIVDIWRYNMGIMPINYAVYQMNLTTPSLQQDLAILYANGYLEFGQSGLEAKDYRYRLSQKGKDFLSAKNTLNDLKDFVEAQPTQPIIQTTPPTTTTNLRPSPTDSATMYSTGRIKVGNDGNLWKVTENKNGVKRWVKVGDIPSDLPEPTPVETPISEIDEDEVDLDILEQQLNDDSLEFDISDEDLDNLEF